MCGLAGYFGRVAEASTFLNESIRDLKHRGPDGDGVFEREWAGMSHCRLALISPGVAGAQPVETASHVLTFNGEIYNWKELAGELRKYRPNSDLSSDGKVLLNSIEVWGIDRALQKFRGIFAFALLDKVNRELFLARDSAGTKPLYYLLRDGVTYFSSEIKVFSKLGLDLDQEQLNEYLTFQNSIGEKCIFKDVFLVSAGSYLRFKNAEKLPSAKIWDPGFFTTESTSSEGENLDQLENLLEQALRRNLVGDFSIGMFLSSGLDSSTISILVSRLNRTAKTYTVGFTDNDSTLDMSFQDEREIAFQLSQSIGLDNFSLEISAIEMERDFDRLCWSIEEPRVGQSYPNYFASSLAREHDKSVLSGAGGDELFGGYPWRYRGVLSAKSLGKIAQLDEYFKIWHRLGTTDDISKLLGVSEQEHTQSGKSKMLNLLNLNSTHSNYFDLEDLLFFEYKTFLQGLLLVDDKIAMSHGLEIRVPFLDQDLVRFAQKLPNQHRTKILAEEQNASKVKEVQGKKLLRDLADRIDNPVRNLPKVGFSGPDESWFRKESKTFVTERLLNPNSCVWDKLDYSVGIKLLNEHFDGTSNNRLLIWSLLSLESTLRQFNL